WVSLKFQYTFTTPNARDAGAHGFEYGAAIERGDEGLDLFLVTRQLDGVDLIGDVDNMAAEYVGHTLHFLAFFADGTHLYKHEFTLDVRPFGKVDDLDDIHQPVQMLGDLFDDVIRACCDNRHARQRGVFS